MHIQSFREGLDLFRALSSEVRISILEYLYHEGPLPMAAISRRLGITSGALTPHIKALADCGLISVTGAQGKHGMQKICQVAVGQIVVDGWPQGEKTHMAQVEVGVGQYTAYEAYPTCGIATSKHLIGQVDDPRFFGYPERADAGVLWLGWGYVEYMIPNLLKAGQDLKELQISLELSSEAPGYAEDWPSDIHFSINGEDLGYWTCPGDFGKNIGSYNPNWWLRNWNQHGMMKLLSVNETGAYIDGTKISAISLQDLQITSQTPSLTLRIAVPENARNRGGLTIFGKGFGNYPQDIKVNMHYKRDQKVRVPDAQDTWGE